MRYAFVLGTELRLEEATEDSERADLPTAHPSFQGLL